MIDLETASVAPDAAILSIGAVRFDRRESPPKRLEDIDKHYVFYIRVDLNSCKELGMHVDDKTMAWWAEQPVEARYEVLENKERVNIKEALLRFKEWFIPHARPWGNGSSFDITILENAFNKVGIEFPWKFWNVRDLRTLYDIAKLKKRDIPEPVVAHHALHDCFHEIIGFYMAKKRIGF